MIAERPIANTSYSHLQEIGSGRWLSFCSGRLEPAIIEAACWGPREGRPSTFDAVVSLLRELNAAVKYVSIHTFVDETSSPNGAYHKASIVMDHDGSEIAV
ncbi:MAG TPA: hypothetical protein PKC18_19195, partial [Lacipirellulaceae bacterium]|nr:hypothetical protein [Lacipirellulaceae bacterium]